MDEEKFNVWNKKKKELHIQKLRPFFKNGEIWWAQLGQNVSTEVVGKGQDFLRPIYILKRVYGDSCIALPLTSKERIGSYYLKFLDSKGKTQYALLPQIRYLDGKRLKYQISRVDKCTQKKILEAFISFINK